MIYELETRTKRYEELEDAQNIIDSIVSNKNRITEIILSYNAFAPLVFKQISKTFIECKSLKSLKLVSIMNSLKFEQISEILEYLAENLPESVIALDFSCNALSCKFNSVFGDMISNHRFVYLNISDCGLGFDGAERLAGYFKNSKHKEALVSLCVSKNRFNKVSEDFISSICGFKNLKNFKISNNTIDQGLPLMISKLTELELDILDISGNFLETQDYLVELIEKLSLAELHIRDMNSEEQFENVISALLNKETLDSLPGSLSKIPTLILDISQNSIDSSRTLELLSMLNEKYDIKKLYVYDNSWDDITCLEQQFTEDPSTLVTVDPLLKIYDHMFSKKLSKL